MTDLGSCMATQDPERVALADALERREPEIMHTCQMRYATECEVSGEAVAEFPVWHLLGMAVRIIVDWLRTGISPDLATRSRIEALGASTATGQMGITSSDLADLMFRSETGDTSGSRGSGELSVGLFITLGLWWSEATCRVLAEEADRLGARDAVLRAATQQVIDGFHATLMRMGKQYDAELTSLRRQLARMALHDALTGLPNRMAFIYRLEQALLRPRSERSGVAVIFMDLDRFKMINDTYGHSLGDQVLSQVAVRMRQAVRPGDVVARLGGDEFVALLENLGSPWASGHAVAERLRREVGRPLIVGDLHLDLRVSIGLAVVEDTPCDADRLLSEADSAMYAAKRSGRDQIAALRLGGPSTGCCPSAEGS